MSLQLGSFIFSVDDLPDKLELGGQQIAAVYQYPGGIKDVQVFGALDDTISMQGTFNYNAEAKVKQLDAMYRSGSQYALKVNNFKTVTVVITKFKPVYRSPYAIDYTIEAEPLTSSFTPANLGPNYYGNSSSSNSGSSGSAVASQQRTYVVVKDDCLWNIAKKFYGTGTLYNKIYEANKSIIKYPRLIYPGQKLVIPS